MKYLFKISTLTCCLLVAYYLICKYLNVNINSAESSFISNQIRLNNLVQSENLDILILGSSLSARLAEEFFSKHRVLNLGLEASGSMFGLESWLKLRKDTDIILIEANSLLFDTKNHDQLLANYLESPQFRLQTQSPVFKIFQPNYRFSSVLYNSLKKIKDNKVILAERLELKSYKAELKTINNVSIIDNAKVLKWQNLIYQLKANNPNTEIVLMMMPDNGRNRSQELLLSHYLANKYNLNFLNFKQNNFGKHCQYTDGLHLNLESARQLAQLIDYNLQIQNND